MMQTYKDLFTSQTFVEYFFFKLIFRRLIINKIYLSCEISLARFD